MKIAYITNGFSSNLNCSYELFRRLRMADHEVLYLSAEDIVARVAQNGYPCVRLLDQARTDESLAVLEPALPMTPTWFSNRREKQKIRMQTLEARELLAAVDRFEADVLVIDIELHFVVLVCLQLDLPIILTIAWFSIFKDEMLPPMHTTLYPPATAQERQRVNALWRKEIRIKRKRRLRRRLKHLLQDFLSPSPISLQTLDTELLRLTAKYHGMNLDSLVDFEQWLRPMVFRNIPILTFNVYEMDFPHNKHECLHYVGPMIFEQRVDPPGDHQSTRQWHHLRDKYRLKETDSPLVYCSLGTFWNTDQVFLSLIIEVFKRRSDWHLVIGLGGKLSADAFGSLPDNITILGWAPQLELLSLADCAITHGGITTINECVYYGVPMLVYSTAHGDQNGCAARVAWHGLGIMGDKADDDSEKITMHIESLMNDPAYKIRLQTMRGHFQYYAEKNFAVEFIEQAVVKKDMQ